MAEIQRVIHRPRLGAGVAIGNGDNANPRRQRRPHQRVLGQRVGFFQNQHDIQLVMRVIQAVEMVQQMVGDIDFLKQGHQNRNHWQLRLRHAGLFGGGPGQQMGQRCGGFQQGRHDQREHGPKRQTHQHTHRKGPDQPHAGHECQDNGRQPLAWALAPVATAFKAGHPHQGGLGQGRAKRSRDLVLHIGLRRHPHRHPLPWRGQFGRGGWAAIAHIQQFGAGLAVNKGQKRAFQAGLRAQAGHYRQRRLMPVQQCLQAV